MNPAEYETMHQVESVHWWYHGLRSMLGRALLESPLGNAPVILDVGCGTGANLRFMRERLPQGRFIALDVSPHALRHIELADNVTVFTGDANALPLSDSSVNLIVACDLLGQAGVNVPVTLRQFHRVLKPGGLLLVNAPAFNWLRGEHDRAVHVVKRFTPGELPAVLHQVGFHEVQERFWNFLALAPMVARRVLTRRRALNSSPRSDLTLTLGWLNPLLSRWLALETKLSWVLRLPSGSSLFVVARKPTATLPARIGINETLPPAIPTASPHDRART